jgi:gluconolactonase
MAVDSDGNLFIATGLGIEVFAPDGARWGVIPVPQVPSNCTFGGTDGRTLFITAQEGLYRVTLANPGFSWSGPATDIARVIPLDEAAGRDTADQSGT